MSSDDVQIEHPGLREYERSKERRDCRTPTKCRSCSASILWAITDPNGKSMPVDTVPTGMGDYILGYRAKENVLIARHVSRLQPSEHIGRNRYSSHFQTCPNAQEHSRKGK
jgi:hypothetical protein